jgi:hypothetical protein
MTKVVVAFSNFAKAPNTQIIIKTPEYIQLPCLVESGHVRRGKDEAYKIKSEK